MKRKKIILCSDKIKWIKSTHEENPAGHRNEVSVGVGRRGEGGSGTGLSGAERGGAGGVGWDGGGRAANVIRIFLGITVT